MVDIIFLSDYFHLVQQLADNITLGLDFIFVLALTLGSVYILFYVSSNYLYLMEASDEDDY